MNSEHISILSWTEAMDRLGSVNKALATSLQGLAKPGSKKVYEVTYTYGNAIIENNARLRPPCDVCEGCKDLQRACEGDYPFAVVLDKNFEVHLKTQDRPGSQRTIPLRLLQPGEAFGLFELLDRLHPDPNGSSAPPWTVVAGAKSIYITSPFKSDPLGEELKRLLPDYFLRRRTGEILQQLTDNPYLLVRSLERAIVQNGLCAPWSAKALVFPLAAVFPALQKRGTAGFQDAAKDFLIEIHGTAWVQSRNLRLRDVEADEIMRKLGKIKHKHTHARAIQQVLAIARGDLPGFVPYAENLMAGPFVPFQSFFLKTLRQRLTEKNRFPTILQPCHIGSESGKSSFAYLSLSVPSCIDEEHFLFNPKIAKDLQGYLQDGMFAHGFTVSLHESFVNEVLRPDFEFQFKAAKHDWGLDERDFFHKKIKSGFAHRFLRIEISKAKAEPHQRLAMAAGR